MNPMNRRIDAAMIVTAIVTPALCAGAFAWPNPAAAGPGHDPKPWSYSLPAPAQVVSEIEPNDNCVFNAQLIGCSVTVTDAELEAPGDVDYYAVSLEVGEVLTVATRSPHEGQEGGHSPLGIDTVLEILSDDCQTVLASDDDTGPEQLAFIPRFVADRSGAYFIRVSGYGDEIGLYRLDVFCGAPTQGHPADRCSPQVVADPCSQASAQGSMSEASNDYDPGPNSCVPYGAAGRDLAFGIPLSAGDRLIADYESEADGVVYLLTDCEDPSGSCVAAADDQDPRHHQAPESLDFTAPIDGVYYLIFDSYGAETGSSWSASYVIECGERQGACCLEGGDCIQTTVDLCSGDYQGDGTICDPNPCGLPNDATGACCIFAPAPGVRSVSGEVCAQWTAAACQMGGGVYQGDGTSCEPDPCGLPTEATGACCLEGNFCVVAQIQGCILLNGAYQGDNTTCDPDQCMPSVPTQSVTWGGLKSLYR